jgi:hypothetical protein
MWVLEFALSPKALGRDVVVQARTRVVPHGVAGHADALGREQHLP